jgi:hypothetical protein
MPGKPTEGLTMDLQTFVTETLLQVCEGLKTAITKEVRVAATCRDVEFDVAVTAVQSGGKRGGAGIFVGGSGIGGQASSRQPVPQ